MYYKKDILDYYKQLIENSFDIFNIISIDGKILYESKATERVLGYDQSNRIGKNAFEYVHPEDSNYVRKEFLNLINGINKNNIVKYRYLHKNGTWVWLESIGQNYLNDKNIRGIIINTRNINHTVALENNLVKEKNRANKENKEKSLILKSVAHDIRAPLNSIIGFLKLLEPLLETEKQREYLSYINESSHYLENLANDILDFTRADQGKLKIKPEIFHLRDSISLIIKSIMTLITKEIELLVNIDPNINDYLIGDINRLRQILINLLTNAIKFTDNGWVKLNIKKLNKNNNNTYLQIEVIDSGRGIPKDKINMIFDYYEQVNSDDSLKFKGCGMGLSIVKKLVELMDGEIIVESRLNIGSKFIVNLKFENVDSYSNDYIDESSFNFYYHYMDKKILIIDDNLMSVKLLSALLKRKGIDYDVSFSAREAMDKINKYKYDIVFLDINMPCIDGIEAFNIIKYKDPKIKVIAFTGYGNINDEDKFLKLGFDYFLLKPIDFQKLDSILIDFIISNNRNYML